MRNNKVYQYGMKLRLLVLDSVNMSTHEFLKGYKDAAHTSLPINLRQQT